MTEKTARFARRDDRYIPENPRLQRAKASVRVMLIRHPRAYWFVMPLYRSATRLRCRLVLRLSGTPRDRFLDVERLLWVPPSEIEYQTLLWGSTLRNQGCGWVLDGDWDRLKNRFASDPRYRAVREVVAGSKRWHETDEYAGAVASIEAGHTLHHCRTRAQLDERYRMLDRLIASIRRDGYKTQRELRLIRSPEAGALGRGDEITVTIGRHGDVLFRDGAHRLAITQVLGVPRIPVQVVARHAEWAAFRKEIERYALARGGVVPQPLLHPDLENIPSRTHCAGRYDTLTASLSRTTPTIIDFFPGWGYFCQRLSADGFTCCAVVHDAASGAFLEKLRRASSRDFRVITPEAIAEDVDHHYEFDVGLMLDAGLSPSLTPTAEALTALLASVKVRELRIEPDALCRSADDAVDLAAKRQRLLDKLLEVGGFAVCERLASSGEAGPLYRLR